MRLRGEISTDYLCRMGLKVGQDFQRMTGCIIDDSHCWLIEIGDRVTLAPRVHLLAHDASTKKHLGLTKLGRIVIGNDVFIGAGSIVLPNVSIGDHVVIGAGSVVTKDIPPYSLAAGNPCRVLSSLEIYIERHRRGIENSPLWDEKYTLRGNISNEHKTEMIEFLKKHGIGYVD